MDVIMLADKRPQKIFSLSSDIKEDMDFHHIQKLLCSDIFSDLCALESNEEALEIVSRLTLGEFKKLKRVAKTLRFEGQSSLRADVEDICRICEIHHLISGLQEMVEEQCESEQNFYRALVNIASAAP